MTPDLAERLSGVILVGGTAIAVAASIYLWIVYVRAPYRSGLFRVLAIAATLATVTGTLIFWPAVLAALDRPRLEYPWTIILVVGGLVASYAIPPLLAGYVLRVRRRARREGRNVPPPGPED